MDAVSEPRTLIGGRIGAGSAAVDVLIVLAAGSLMALFARVSIPLGFTPVPVTGQTFGVLITGAALGSRRGAAAMLVYLAEGAAGLPVFALGLGGPAVLTGPTGGYLVALPVAAFVVGWLAERGWDRTVAHCAFAMLTGEVIIYLVGLPWLSHFVGASHTLSDGLYPFIPGDLIKLALAALVLPSAWAIVRGIRSWGATHGR